MSEDKDSGKSGDWFPNFNQLLVVLLAGTLFVSQTPFHESRPSKSEATASIAHKVDARPWQDPFEAVKKYIEKHDKPADLGNVKAIQGDIESKISGNGLKEIGVIAVMLPGDPYFEDSETRRKVRYAVLSGFNATLRYNPEDSGHIHFFEPGTAKDSIVAYEWMVYKPHKKATKNKEDERTQRPPVLVLWLNGNDFKVTPHETLKTLIANLKPAKGTANNTIASVTPIMSTVEGSTSSSAPIGTVSILGPFDSDGLQGLVKEMANDQNDQTADSNRNYIYYSPSATMQESNLLEGTSSKTLHDFFKGHGLKFLRVTATDEHLAVAIKDELKLRGIEPNKENRILLVGEWDTLYTWHLINTFAAEFLKDRDKECKDEKTEKVQVQNWDKLYKPDEQCIFRASYLRGLDGETQKGNGEKEDGGNNKSSSGSKNAAEAKGVRAENLENASGDSQFDYVRRLAAQIEELDKTINHNSANAHAIKAIGILGSDVYDKLLISEALHSKFPDAVFFTNGMDARFLEPDHNQWSRNMIVASSFGLQLNYYRQKDIPPFRDNTQTAFFLATEMALANQFPDKVNFSDDMNEVFKALRMDTQNTALQSKLDERLMPDPDLSGKRPARIFELGRTKAFDLNIPCESEKPEEPCLSFHPNPNSQSWKILFLVTTILVVWAVLFSVQASKQFLGQVSGFYFVFSMVMFCAVCLIISKSMQSVMQQPPLILVLMPVPLALIYAYFIYRIASCDNRLTDDENRNFTKFFYLNLIVNLLLIASGLGVIWGFVEPQGWLDNKEPYALLEGVSTWPSQAVRFVAFILASYFILEVFRFPKAFISHFHLKELGKKATEHLSTDDLQNYVLLYDWQNWQDFKRRCLYVLVWGTVFYSIEIMLFQFFGIPNVPYRGDSMFLLNGTLLQGLLVPAAIILLVLVTDAVKVTVYLVERSFPDDLDNEEVKWPEATYEKYAAYFKLQCKENDMSEWVGMRFIAELTRRIYGLIGYPLIIALLIVVAFSSYLDNWQTPMVLKLMIGFSLGWLLFWDHSLKKAAEKARGNALKSLHVRVIKCLGTDHEAKTRSEQLDRIISLIENYDETVYKSFTQRPIFQYSLLVVLALLADSVDYALLASKLFMG